MDLSSLRCPKLGTTSPRKHPKNPKASCCCLREAQNTQWPDRPRTKIKKKNRFLALCWAAEAAPTPRCQQRLVPAASRALLPAQNVPAAAAEREGRGKTPRELTSQHFSLAKREFSSSQGQGRSSSEDLRDGKGRNRLETRPSFRERPHNQPQRPAPRVPRKRIRCFVLREGAGHGEQNTSYGKTPTTALTS